MQILQKLQDRVSELQMKIDTVEKSLEDMELKESARNKHLKTLKELRELLHSSQVLIMKIHPGETVTLH